MGQNNLDISFGRIATSDKLPDRLLTSGKISSVTGGRRLSCFYLIEISSPFFANSHAADIIKYILEKNYSNGSNEDSPVYHFEHTLKKINTSLADLAKTGETDWVGALSAVIVEITGNEILISQTGDASVFLFRKLRISHLTEGLNPDQTPHPLKTFSNLITGDILPEDRLIIANQTLFDFLPLDKLRQLLLTHGSSITAQILAKQLKRERVKTVNALIIKANDPITSKKSSEPLQDTFYLDQPGANVIREAKKVITPGIKKGSQLLIKTYKSTCIKLKEYKYKKSINESDKTFPLISDKLRSHANIGFWASTYYKIKNAAQKLKFLPLLYISLAVILLIISVIGIKKSQQTNNIATSKESQEESVNNVKSLIDKGLSAELKKDSVGAHQNFSDAILLANSINLPERQTEIDQLKSQAQKKLDSLDKVITLPTLAPSVKFSGQKIDNFALTKNTIFGLEKSTGSLWQSSTPYSSVTQAFSNFTSPPLALFPNDDSNIYISAVKNLFQFSVISKTVTSIKAASLWPENILDIKNYLNNLYILDNTGQVLKYSKNGEEYNKSSNYLKEPVQTPAKSLAIDGNVWLLGSSSIDSFAKGKFERRLDITKIPKGNNFNKIFTDSGNIIWLTDIAGGRVVEITKDGSYIRQLILPKSGTMKDIYISPKDKKVYFLADSSIYIANL